MPDYGNIIKRSIAVVKKYKWLWVYGALVAAGGGGGGSGGGRNGTSNTIQELRDMDGSVPEKTSKVLGEYTSALLDWLLSVSPVTWILLVLGILIAIVLAIVIGLILRKWAAAGLIYGSELALSQASEVSLANTTKTAKAKVKSLIIFSLISTGLFLALLVILPSFWGIIYFLVKGSAAMKTFWTVAGIITGIFILIISLVFLAMISVYAERLIVLKSMRPWDAWKKGLSLSKSNFIMTAVMGIINAVSTTAFGCLSTILALIVLGIPSFVMIYPSIKNQAWPPFYVFAFLGIVLLIFILFVTLIGALSAVFKFSNWNQIFKIAIENEELKNQDTTD